MPYVENLPEFIARNGNHPLRVGTKMLLPNGAIVEDVSEGMFRLREAPTTEPELLRAKRNYHTALLARIEGHFNSLKAVLLGTDFNSEAVRWPEMFGPDPGDGKARLLRLKLLAQEQREAIAELDQEIEALPEVAAQRARERAVAEAQREAQSRAEAHRLAIEAITL